ncbi:MAG: CPBP family intramembrane metalloprotease [Balneolaceae bacterium]|nr:MAG: CPBP family intramembrane metalloprotease [Balneolaceae bacterium]
MNTAGGLKHYHRTSSSLTYSYLISLPLLILYEVLIIISQPAGGIPVRLGAEMWIKQLMLFITGNTLLFTVLLVLVLGAFIFYKERKREIDWHPRYLLFMVAESVVWALVLAVIISNFVGFLFQFQAAGGGGVTRLQMLALSIGAGLYEELVFRVILVYGLIKAGELFFTNRRAVVTVSVIFAALVFSAVHYTGSMGDSFAWASFIFRFLFGLALNLLLVIRGFGIAACTHSLYDVILVLFLYDG